MNISRLEHSLFSQIRFGILPIEIEVGRYRQKPVEERFCYHCKDEIEDELRFLFSCKAYKNWRNNLPYYDHCKLNTADEKFLYFNNLLHNNSITRVLIKFVKDAYEMVNSLIYKWWVFRDFAAVCTVGAWFLFFEWLIAC